MLWLDKLLITLREPGGDALSYLQMANWDWDISNIMAAYRPLTPILTRVIYIITPLDTANSFELLTLLILFSTSVMFYYFLRDLKFTLVLRALGCFFLLQSSIFIYFVWNPWLVDPLALLIILSSIWAIIRGKNRLYIILLVLAALNKEAYGYFTLPAFYVWNLEEGKIIDWKLILKTALLALIPTATILLIVHSEVIPQPTENMYGEGATYWQIRLGSASPKSLVEHTSKARNMSFIKQDGVPHIIYGSWHALWIFAILGLTSIWKKRKYSRMWFPALLLLFTPWFMTPARLSAIQFVFVIPFALWELQFLGENLSKITRIAGSITLILLYRLYSTFEIRDKAHIDNLENLGMKLIFGSYYPVGFAVFFATAPILLHVLAVLINKSVKKG